MSISIEVKNAIILHSQGEKMKFEPSIETLKRRDGTVGDSGFNERLRVNYFEGPRSFTEWFFINERDDALSYAKEKNSVVEHEVQNCRTGDGQIAFVVVGEIRE